jgi:hypothetical protein
MKSVIEHYIFKMYNLLSLTRFNVYFVSCAEIVVFDYCYQKSSYRYIRPNSCSVAVKGFLPIVRICIELRQLMN